MAVVLQYMCTATCRRGCLFGSDMSDSAWHQTWVIDIKPGLPRGFRSTDEAQVACCKIFILPLHVHDFESIIFFFFNPNLWSPSRHHCEKVLRNLRLYTSSPARMNASIFNRTILWRSCYWVQIYTSIKYESPCCWSE